MNNNYDDIFEVEEKDGKHHLNDQSSSEVAKRAKKTGGIIVLTLAVLLGCGAMAMSWVKSKLHTQPTEEHMESDRKITEAPENIGKTNTIVTLPSTPTPPSDETAASEPTTETPEQDDFRQPEPIAASDNQQPKPPTLTERRLAGGDMQANPQNANQQAEAVAVRMVKNMNLTLMKGTKIPCVLENNIVSEQDGFTSCIVSHDVYSGNAHTLLIEKGSRITGMYSGSVKNGDKRLQIIWDRIITPFDLAIDLNSPTTDRLGSSGVTGKVDNRYLLRFGSALMVSLISDALNIAADRHKNAEVYIESDTAETGHDIAKKVLEKNIDLSPIIYIKEGQTIQIYVQQDIDFANAYRIRKQMLKHGFIMQ